MYIMWSFYCDILVDIMIDCLKIHRHGDRWYIVTLESSEINIINLYLNRGAIFKRSLITWNCSTVDFFPKNFHLILVSGKISIELSLINHSIIHVSKYYRFIAALIVSFWSSVKFVFGRDRNVFLNIHTVFFMIMYKIGIHVHVLCIYR